MTTGERQRLRETAFDLLGDENIESKMAAQHGLNLDNQRDRKEVREAITRVKNAMERLKNGTNTP